MPFKEFVWQTLLHHYHLFPLVDLTIQHEAIQHFYSYLVSHQLHVLGYDVHYTAFTPSSGRASRPNLADGGFVINNLNDVIPIQYKMRNPNATGNFDNFLIKHFVHYNETSSIIELGVKNWDFIDPKIQIPQKVLIMDYSHLDQPVTEEFKQLTYDLIHHRKNNLLNAEELNRTYHKEWSYSDYTNSKYPTIVETIKKVKTEI